MDEQSQAGTTQSPAQKPKKKRSKARLIAYIFVIIIIWLGAIQYMAAERYDAIANVVEGENKVGVNPTSQRLDFGDLSRNTGASKTVTIKNTGKRAKKIMVWKRGELSEIMNVSKNNFELKPGEETKVVFTVQIPASAEYRKYGGKVVIFKWPNVF